jgi:heme/copper-type cytochrome/quinol oxidase subunit 2
MAKRSDKNHVSVLFWMFMLFVMALPCVGFIVIFVWAFVGDNETRKNYCRAIIAWGVILTAIWLGIMAFGFKPQIEKKLQTWLQQSR